MPLLKLYPFKSLTTLLPRKESFHLTATDPVIPGAVHTATAQVTAWLERTNTEPFIPAVVLWNDKHSTACGDRGKPEWLAWVRPSLWLMKRWVHISRLQHCSVALHLAQSLTEGRIIPRALLGTDATGQTNFSVPVPSTHESKKQAK